MKIILSKHVTFNETSLLKSTIAQQEERLKIKNISQWVEVDATPPSPVDSVLVGISLDVTPGGDHVVVMDTEHVELIGAKEIKLNPRKWVKKHESQIAEIDNLKLKVVILHDSIGKKVHITQPVGFVAADFVTAD